MKSKLVVFIGGFFVGVFVMAAVNVLTRPVTAPPGAAQATPGTMSDLKKQLASAREQSTRLENENAKLTADLLNLQGEKAAAAVAETQPTPKSPLAGLLGGGSDTNRSAAFGKMIRASMKQQVEMRLTALKTRLHLTADQEGVLRELLEKQFGTAGDMAAKMFEGKLSKEEMQKASKSPGDFRGDLKNVLSEEQWAEYEKYEKEERQNQAQMMANVELTQLQGMLQLSQEQQDKVFQVLYDHAEGQIPQTAGGIPDMTNWQDRWQKGEEAKREALKAVLTPEQFQSYEKYQQSQQEMIKAVTESFTVGDSTGTISTTTIVVPATTP